MSELIILRVDTPTAQFCLNGVNFIKGNDCELLHLLNQSILDRQRFWIKKTWFQDWVEQLLGYFVEVKRFVKRDWAPGNKRVVCLTVEKVVVVDYESLLTERAHGVWLHERFLRCRSNDLRLHRLGLHCQGLIRSELSRL